MDTAPIDSPGISTRLLGVIRVLVPALAGALACASILIGFLHRPAAWPNAGPIGDGGKAARVRGWFTSDGFYRPELEAGSGRQFSWTSGSAALRIDHIDRSVPWRVEIRARAGRAPGIALPDVTISVDDVATSLNIKASIGISLFPQHATDAATLVSSADRAMYQAKHDKSGYSFVQ